MVHGSRYDYPFDPDTPNNTAATLFRVVREGGARVLDIGSGPGVVAGALVHLADKEVTCLDLEDDHLEAAAQRGVQRTVRADLSGGSWADELAGDRFDVIVLADVLEHLVDPGAVLARIAELGLLADDGYLAVSIPNASHISMLGVLAVGDFPYRPTGLLDETHLRFFTLRSFQRLLEAHGFGIVEVHRTTRRLDETELHDVTWRLDPDLVRQLERQHAETDTYQYVLKVTTLHRSRKPVETEDVEELRRRLRRARNGRTRVQEQLAEAQHRIDELERRLAEVHRSRTWRAGRLIVGGPAAIARRLRRR